MASTINSDNGVSSGSSGLKSTADTSGVLALQSNGTTGLTLNTSLALGVGSGNSTGTSGQLLTSGGSGAAPTWTTVSSAPTITATASGSISAGAPVILNSDGTVSAVTETESTTGVVNFSYAMSAIGNNSCSFPATCLDTKRNKVYKVWINVSDSTSLLFGFWAASGTVDVDTQRVNFGAATQINNRTNNSLAITSVGTSQGVLVYDSTNDQLYYFYMTSLASVRYLVISISDDGSFKVSQTNPLTISPSTPINILSGGYYDASINRIVLIGSKYTQGNPYAWAFLWSTTTNVLTNSTESQLSAQAANVQIGFDYSPTLGRTVIAYGYGTAMSVVTFTYNGSSYTVGALNQLLSPTVKSDSAQVTYSSVTNTWVFQFADNTNTYPQVVVATLSGTTFTFGTAVQVDTYNVNNKFSKPLVSGKTGNFWAVYANFTKYGTISGTSVSFGSAVTIGGGSTFNSNPVSLYVPANNLWFLCNAYDTVEPDLSFRLSSTTLKSTNFAGLASASYTNGQTATINVVGSKDTNVSGLTAGKKYYVDVRGGLTTTPTPAFVGVATSATAILIKG